MKPTAARRGSSLRLCDSFIEVKKGDGVTRILREHTGYLDDVLNSYDHYFDAVLPTPMNGLRRVDYAGPRYHDMVGFEMSPIMFPSFPEPVVTARQYLHFASLSPAMVVIDLGAYSGLTSMIFSQAVGDGGVVVAVDADPLNLDCMHRNIGRYLNVSHSCIKIMEGAVWNHARGIEFSCEGNRGGSASAIVGGNRGRLVRVDTFTLDDIAEINRLSRVDFIKCDVEGEESLIFEDDRFFSKFKPKIIVEPHFVNGQLTTDKVRADRSRYGYVFRAIPQDGVQLPLLECIPPPGAPASRRDGTVDH